MNKESNKIEENNNDLKFTALKFYLSFIVISIIWMFLRDGKSFFKKLNLFSNLTDVLSISFIFIFFVVFLSFLLTNFTKWGKESEKFLFKTLGNLNFIDILIMALMSGIAEELFFRGCIQLTCTEIWGAGNAIFLTSIIFGLFHPPVDKKLFYFPYMAFFMSLGLGWTLFKTTNILCPIIIHFGINFCNMSTIQFSQKHNKIQ